jgi:NTP pyrophosphatase (non-canonical NTP hydrolase)
MKFEAEIILMEECGELVQALSKVIRTDARKDTLMDMSAEIADVQLLIELVRDKYGIEVEEVQRRMRDKAHKLQRWSNLYEGKN